MSSASSSQAPFGAILRVEPGADPATDTGTAMNVPTVVPRPERGKAGGREWTALAVLALPCIVYAMDLTVLNLAIPSISAEVKPTAAQLLWIVDSFGFLAAGALLVMGTLGDRIGRRKLLLFGSGAFAVISLFAAFSTTAPQLIAARAALGIAGATLAPSTLSLINSIFRDEREKSFAISVWIASFSFGGAIGPVVGGVLLDHFHWSAVFLVPIPVMALLLIAGPRLLPEYRDPHPGRIDLASAILVLATILPLIFAVKHLAEGGSAPTAGLAGLVGIVCGVTFVRRQFSLADPLLDMRLFANRQVSAALTINVLNFLVGFGNLVLIAQYLQLVLDLGPFAAGLWSAPAGLAYVVGSLASSPLRRRLRPASALAAGLAVAACGFLLMAWAAHQRSVVLLTFGDCLFSLGAAPATAIVADFVVSASSEERAGAASALSETCSEFGGAVGIALFGSLATWLFRSALGAAVPDGVPADAFDLALRGIGAASDVARGLGDGTALVAAAKEAYVRAAGIAFLVASAITAATAVFASIAFGWKRPEARGA